MYIVSQTSECCASINEAIAHSHHDWNCLGELCFLIQSCLTTQLNAITNGIMPRPNISSVTLCMCVRVCDFCMYECVLAITWQPKVYNQIISYETSTIIYILTHGIQQVFLLYFKDPPTSTDPHSVLDRNPKCKILAIKRVQYSDTCMA